VSLAPGRITAAREVIYRRYDPAAFVGRDWLLTEVERFRQDLGRRQLVIVGEPGSGKSAFIAFLAEHWNCPRHFIRVDSVGGVTGVSARAFLISIGAQLFQKYGPDIFARPDPAPTRVSVGVASGRAHVVGRFIEELHALPFLPCPEGEVDVRVIAAIGDSEVVGEHVGRLVDVAEALDERTLLHVALVEPLRILHDLHPDEQVVVAVDALDESLYHPAPRIQDVLPRVSDAGYPQILKLVMTSRAGDHLAVFPPADRLDLEDAAKGYRDESRKDARRYIERRLGEPPLAEAIATRPVDEVRAFVRRIDDGGAGNFLYLYHLLNETADSIRDGVLDLGSMRVPRDLDDVYRVFAVEKIKAGATLHDWVELYQPLLATLAVVREPVDRELLAGFAGVGIDYADYVLGQLRQFLEAVEDGVRLHYRLYHSSFAEYLLDPTRNREFPLDAARSHGRIGTYYQKGHAGWPGVDWGAIAEIYPFRHLTAHLATARAYEELYALIGEPWMHAQLQRSLSHRAFAADVDVAIVAAVAETPANIVQLVRGALIRATLGSLASNIPAAVLGVLAASGQSGWALGHAALVLDPAARYEAYRLIGEALRRRGETAQAVEALQEALRAAARIGKDGYTGLFSGLDTRGRAVMEASVALARAGEERAALAAMEGVGGERDRAVALVEVVCALAEGGHVERALAFAGTVTSESDRARVLARAAAALAEKGDVDQALGIVSTIARASRFEALSSIARALVSRGSERADEVAGRLLEEVRDARLGGTVLLSVIDALVEGGKREEAASIVERSIPTTSGQHASVRANALAQVAQAFVRLGDEARATEMLEGAIAAVDENKHAFAKDADLREIAGLMAEVGAAEWATSIARAIDDPATRTETLQRVVKALAAAGETASAIEAAEGISDSQARAEALSRAALAIVERGESDSAIEVVGQVLQLVGTQRTDNGKAIALGAMARALVRAGAAAEAKAIGYAALKAMENMDDAQDAARALRDATEAVDLGPALAQAGHMPANERAQALSGIVEAAIATQRSRRLGWILYEMEKIADPEAKVRAIGLATPVVAESGDREAMMRFAEHALAAVEDTPPGQPQAWALVGIALGLARAREGPKSVEAARRALNIARELRPRAGRPPCLRPEAGRADHRLGGLGSRLGRRNRRGARSR
jgi:tetratricopeptide (TPR) repeat protein